MIDDMETGSGWMTPQFNIQVGCYVEEGVTDAATGQPVVAYHVALPHSCDTWDITVARSRDEAVADLTAFIEEAQAALAELQRRPVGEDVDERPVSYP